MAVDIRPVRSSQKVKLTTRVRRCFNRVQELHSLNVIEINAIFLNDHQPFPVQLHSQDGCRKCQFAYCRLTL